jgi:hypothetical protein
MSLSREQAIDGGIALALVGVLGLVFLFDRGSPPGNTTVTPVVVQAPEEPVASKALRLAVTPPQWDDMGKLLDQLGSGFTHDVIRLEDLDNLAKLSGYDVIFWTCGTVPESWTLRGDLGSGLRPGVIRVRPNLEVMDRVKSALRTFVGRGGTLYASDWRIETLSYCFPELSEGSRIATGDVQVVRAEVVDPGLREVLGPVVELRFDQPGWYPARLSGEGSTIYLRGVYRGDGGVESHTAPLLVKVPFGKGTIIFTSFHNEKNNGALELKLLKFLVFAAVTAEESSKAHQTMVSLGFSPRKENLLTPSSANPTITQAYQNPRRGRLRFALSFRNEGARLKLTVRGPDGKTQEQEGTSSFHVDVADAVAGEWSYTVTALKVPYENFASTVTVGSD